MWTLENETIMMSENGGHQLSSCMQPHHWRMEMSATLLRNPKNSHQWVWLSYNNVAKGYLTKGQGKRIQGVNGGMESKVEWPENDGSGMLPLLAHCSSWPSLCNAPIFFFAQLIFWTTLFKHGGNELFWKDSNCVPFDMASYARILGSLSTLTWYPQIS